MKAGFKQKNRQKARSTTLVKSVDSILQCAALLDPFDIQTATMKKAGAAAQKSQLLANQQTSQPNYQQNHNQRDDTGNPQSFWQTKTQQQRHHPRKDEHRHGQTIKNIFDRDG